MQRSSDRILTTHTGSLPRPADLVSLYAERATGTVVDHQRLHSLGRDATLAAVRKQLCRGLDVINNGEQEREGFFLYVQHRMSGFAGSWQRMERQDVCCRADFQAQLSRQNEARVAVSNFSPPTAVSKVSYLNPDMVHAECRSFASALQACKAVPGEHFREAFITAPSPGIVASAMRNDFYPSLHEYLSDLAQALRIEYEAIVAAGYLLQVDCPDLALERHVSFQDQPLSAFLEFAEAVVASINTALEGIPKDRVRLHVCWGNYEGPHDFDVPLTEILPILRQARVGAFVLPFANPRHAHEYRCLQNNPLDSDQLLVAGVIDTLTSFVEHPEVVADRIVQIAEAMSDPSRVLAGTDCGFDTSAGMGRVAESIVWSKLESLVEGARLASARLF